MGEAGDGLCMTALRKPGSLLLQAAGHVGANCRIGQARWCLMAPSAVAVLEELAESEPASGPAGDHAG